MMVVMLWRLRDDLPEDVVFLVSSDETVALYMVKPLQPVHEATGELARTVGAAVSSSMA